MILLVIASIFAILYRKGGDGSGKLYRRVALPLLTSLIYWLTNVNFWWLSFPIGLLAFSLPITLKGDSIHDHWFNWAWIPVLGVIMGLITLNLTYSIVFSLCFTALTVLSNRKKTAEIFKWQVCEMLFGFLLGALIAY